MPRPVPCITIAFALLAACTGKADRQDAAGTAAQGDAACLFQPDTAQALETAGFADLTHARTEMFAEHAADVAQLSDFAGRRQEWHYALPRCQGDGRLPSTMPSRLAIMIDGMERVDLRDGITVFRPIDEGDNVVVEAKDGYYLVFYAQRGL